MHYYDYIFKIAMDSGRYTATTSSERLILFWGIIAMVITIILIVAGIVHNMSPDSRDPFSEVSSKLKLSDSFIIIGLVFMFFGSALAINTGLPIPNGKVEHKQYGDSLIVLQRFHVGDGDHNERDIVKTFKLQHPKDHVTTTKLESIKTYNRHVVLNEDSFK